MIHWHESLESTMHEAARLAAANAPHLTAVVADQQTAGMGRHGHSWYSAKGLGLYVSVVLRLEGVEGADLPVVTLALGLAAAAAIGRDCDLRWPNDVLIRGRKVCGILAQLHGPAVVAGVGVNVNHTSFPAELVATSLRMESGSPGEIDRRELLDALLVNIEHFCAILQRQGRETILELFEQASTYARGKRVRIEDTGDTGVTDGLDAAGFLMLKRDGDGRRITIHAGGVRPLEREV